MTVTYCCDHEKGKHAKCERITSISPKTRDVLSQLRGNECGDQHSNVDGRDEPIEKSAELNLLLGQLELVTSE